MRHAWSCSRWVGLVVLLHLPSVLPLATPQAPSFSSHKMKLEPRGDIRYAEEVMAWLDTVEVPWRSLELDWETTVVNPVLALGPPPTQDSSGRPPIALHLIPSPKLLSDSIPPNLTRHMTELCDRSSRSSSCQHIPKQIIHLHEDVWRSKNSIVKARLLSRVGRIVSRVYARKTVCRRIDKPTALAFMNSNHLWGAVRAKFNYGLFSTEDDGTGQQSEVLVAVAAFGPRRRVNRDSKPFSSFELIRFCTRVDGRVVGGITKVLSHFIRCHDPDDIVTVIDRDWGTASDWKGLGFESVQIMPSLVMAVGQDGIRRHLVGAGIRPTGDHVGGISEANDNKAESRPGLPSSVLEKLSTVEELDWERALRCMSDAGFHPVYDTGVERLMLLTSRSSDEGMEHSASELWSLSEPKYAQKYYSDNSGIRAMLRHSENGAECLGTGQHAPVLFLQDEEIRYLYLERIGIDKPEAVALLSREPNVKDLQRLLSAHLFSVPFENMDQHSHPSHGATPEIPRRRSTPSLDIRRSLDKIIRLRRGGFCFELNLSFAWLLRSLGYRARLALADVGCTQAVPGHVVVLLDGLSKEPLLVDVGFGSPGGCEIVLPVVYDMQASDPHGDLFHFRPDNATDRFDTALYRKRVVAPDDDEAMYRFRIDDDLDFDADEFKTGLERALTTSPTFTTKRICVLFTDRGRVVLVNDSIKWDERGETVKREELPTETAWRLALRKYFGVSLCPQEDHGR